MPGAPFCRQSRQLDLPDIPPYRLRDDFLSPAEAGFFRVLRAIVGDRYLICPKVSLGDLFFTVLDGSEEVRAMNRIAQKHVDFLLCDPATLKPVLALELDDRSHRRPDRAARDAFVERVFAAAGLPLVRVPVRPGYNIRELGELIRQGLPDADEWQLPPWLDGAPRDVGGPPLCPKCGVEMVLRTAQRGANKGKPFYGCPNYPRCREMAPATDDR